DDPAGRSDAAGLDDRAAGRVGGRAGAAGAGVDRRGRGDRVVAGEPVMKGATLFSGIGAPELAMPWVDWRWCAGSAPLASAVHAARFPDIVNHGDVAEIRADAVEPVDLIVVGRPCQSFSVAGRRLGLDDPRGNLALSALR